MNDNKMITQSRIIEEYGWTKSLISKFLPDPVLKANPHYRKAAPISYLLLLQESVVP